MGNCCRKLLALRLGQFRSSDYRNIAILLIGLDNAGKTSVANGISGCLTGHVLPTVGFSAVAIKYKRHSVTLYDVGGGPQIRNIWKQYYGNVHGFIFIIDASDVGRLNECKEVFSNMIWHEKVFGKPILIYLNKQDKEETIHEFDITEHMDVEKLVNLRQCPTKVETCSALPFEQVQGCRHLYISDPNLISGFRWLVNFILLNYKQLNERVLDDEKQQVELAELRRKEWKLRNKKNETNSSDNSPTEVNFRNPFKPVSEFLKEPDAPKVTVNGWIGKTSPSANNSRHQSVDAVIEKNNISPPVETVNPRNSAQKLAWSFMKPDDKNSHDKTLNFEDDDDDVNMFYAQALQQDSVLAPASPNLSVFTISGNVKPVPKVAANERVQSPSDESDRKKKSGKKLLPFRRVNKTGPAPEDRLSSNAKPSSDLALGNYGERNGRPVSSTNSSGCQLELTPSSQNFTAYNKRPGAPGEIRSKSKGIFTRNKRITSSTECILTDSDSADVVF